MTEITNNDQLSEAIEANKDFQAANTAQGDEIALLKKQLADAGDDVRQAKKEAKIAKAGETRAKNKQVMRTDRFEAEDQTVGQDSTREFEEGPDNKLDGIITECQDESMLKEKAKMLAFMEEPVMIQIHEVTEESADHGFPVYVNGKPEVFFRGQTKTVKRKFVEGLARARKTGYKCVEQINQATGVKEFVYPSNTGLRFPFSVVEDRNPLGRQWLTHTLRQP